MYNRIAQNGVCLLFVLLVCCCAACQRLPDKMNASADDADLLALSEQGIKFEPEWVIIPGKRVGLVTAQTTRENLQQWFGTTTTLTDQRIPDRNGNTRLATVYAIDNRNTLTVFWQDQNMNQVSEVRIAGEHARWATPEGVSIGLPIEEVQKINGQDFSFSAFVPQSQVGGIVNEWNGGKLANYKGWQLALAYDGRDELAEVTLAKLPPNTPYVSNAEFIASLNVTVREIVVYF